MNSCLPEYSCFSEVIFFLFKILMNVQKILIYVGNMENVETEMETITVTVNKALK